MEALHQSRELGPRSTLQTPLHVEAHVLGLGVLCHREVVPTRLELMGGQLAKVVVLHCKRVVDDVRDVIVPVGKGRRGAVEVAECLCLM